MPYGSLTGVEVEVPQSVFVGAIGIRPLFFFFLVWCSAAIKWLLSKMFVLLGYSFGEREQAFAIIFLSVLFGISLLPICSALSWDI